MFGGRKHGGNFNFFSESELGCGPQDSVGKRSSPVFAILRELTPINAKKFLKNRAFILIARNVFVALAVGVAKAPYIHESYSSILVYCKRKSIRIRWTNCLYYKTLRIYRASYSKSIET